MDSRAGGRLSEAKDRERSERTRANKVSGEIHVFKSKGMDSGFRRSDGVGMDSNPQGLRSAYPYGKTLKALQYQDISSFRRSFHSLWSVRFAHCPSRYALSLPRKLRIHVFCIKYNSIPVYY